jgi:uncharacterized protein (TIGR03437 family)
MQTDFRAARLCPARWLLLLTLAATVAPAQNYALPAWESRIAKLQKTNAGPVTVAFIGDSWTANDLITGPLRTALQARFGNAGIGYVPFDNSDSSTPLPGVVKKTTGVWSEVANLSRTFGLNVRHVTSSDTLSPASKQITAVGSEFVIHYEAVAGGGTFQYAIDNGPWTSVATGAPSNTYRMESSGGLSPGTHALTIRVTAAGSAGVSLMGVDCRLETPGIRLHRIGSGGAKATNYASVSAANWEAGLRGLAPDIVVLLLGTNDMSNNVAPKTVTDALVEMTRRIRSAAPAADIVLATPSDNGMTGRASPMSDYAAAIQGAAAATGTAFLDFYTRMGPYAAANAQGLYYGDAHVNKNGGAVLADYAFNYLTGTVVNAASYVGGPISPGEIILFSGIKLGPDTLAVAEPAGDRYPVSVGRLSVSFDGVPAPILYASARATCVIVPLEAAQKPITQAVISYQNVHSAPITLVVAKSAPGVFSANASGGGPGAILNQNDSVNSPSNPARRGSVISVYLTGSGVLSPPLLDGYLSGTLLRLRLDFGLRRRPAGRHQLRRIGAGTGCRSGAVQHPHPG